MQFIRTKLVGVFLLAIVGATLTSQLPFDHVLVGQEIDEFAIQSDREFVDEDGELLAAGSVKSISGSKVIIREGSGKEVSLAIGRLSEEDRAHVKEVGKAQRARTSARKKFTKYVEDNLNTNSDSKVAAGLSGIRRLAKDAPFAPNVLQRYMGPDQSDKIRVTAFEAYVATTAMSRLEFEKIMTQVINDQFDVMEKVAKSPREYMSAIATFEDHSLSYLTFVAYSGDLIPEDTDAAPPSEIATDLDELKSRSRAAAITALSSMPGEDTLDIVLEVLEAARNPTEGDPNAASIRACIAAFGEMEMFDDDRVDDQLSELETDFPKQVASARRKLAKAKEDAADDE